MFLIDRFRHVYGILGIKQITTESVLPIFLLPLVFGIAAINVYYMIVVCFAAPLALTYIYWVTKKTAPRTKFFYMWTLWSIIYLWILFEITVPLLELLPEENFLFILCIFSSILCFYKAKERGAFNIQSNGADYNLCNETLVLIPDDIQNIPHAEENESEEETRPKLGYQLLNEPISYRTPKTYRCTICQYSTSRWIRHSIWLDCCIGEHNRHLFLLGCSLGIFALFFGSNLSLTSICHPYFVFKLFTINVLMPDDCSDVFDQFDISLCFVGSVYAAAMAAYGVFIVLQHLYIIISNWKREEKLHRSCFLNLKMFLCCYHR